MSKPPGIRPNPAHVGNRPRVCRHPPQIWCKPGQIWPRAYRSRPAQVWPNPPDMWENWPQMDRVLPARPGFGLGRTKTPSPPPSCVACAWAPDERVFRAGTIQTQNGGTKKRSGPRLPVTRRPRPRMSGSKNAERSSSIFWCGGPPGTPHQAPLGLWYLLRARASARSGALGAPGTRPQMGAQSPQHCKLRSLGRGFVASWVPPACRAKVGGGGV